MFFGQPGNLLLQFGDALGSFRALRHEPEVAEYASRVIVVRDGLVQTDSRRTPRRAEVQP